MLIFINNSCLNRPGLKSLEVSPISAIFVVRYVFNMKGTILVIGIGIFFSGCLSDGESSPIIEDQPEKKLVEYRTYKSVQVYTTAQNSSLRLSDQGAMNFEKARQPLETEIAIFVNPEKEFQTYLGIGGAITDASAEVFYSLPKEKQTALLDAYFDKEKGIGYSVIRTNINSCDFSSASYTYIAEGDKELKTFDIAPDRKHKLPMIKEAIAKAGGDVLTYASPWSPPAFMKDNKDVLQGGKLLPEFAPSWALYYAKFIMAYESEGVPIWGITIQNEPMARQRWESCIYTAEEERDFLKNHLGPTLEKEGLGDKNIVVWDHNRDLMPHRANTIFDDPEAAQYAWGMGFHWYETWTGGEPMFDNLGAIRDAYPDVNLMFTEGCAEKFDASKYEYWPNAERYGRSMINDFNQGTAAWTDWNILLDERGGPNHVGNFCFAPVHANLQTGELIFTPIYYYIGHFSKFIGKDAKRVSTQSSRSVLQSTSFQNTSGELVSIVMNATDESLNYLFYAGEQVAAIEIPPRAIQTLVSQ